MLELGSPLETIVCANLLSRDTSTRVSVGVGTPAFRGRGDKQGQRKVDGSHTKCVDIRLDLCTEQMAEVD